MHNIIAKDSYEVSRHVARNIANLIHKNNLQSRPTVLGLATGSTPVLTYRELVRLHREEGLSFNNVVIFNLDQYYPIQRDAEQCYHRFMKTNLLDHIDICPANFHIPDGTIPIEEIERHCANYEKKITACGGIDLQILGIGRTGHIAFNEPGSLRNSVTRRVYLHDCTRHDAANDFHGLRNVPHMALTMGISSILAAKQIYLIAFGTHKASIVRATLEGDVCAAIPASFLRNHHNVYAYLDYAAASKLNTTQSKRSPFYYSWGMMNRTKWPLRMNRIWTRFRK